MIPYQVTVRRRAPSPLTLTMLVGAESREAAAALATALAERERGGMFESGRVRVAPDATEWTWPRRPEAGSPRQAAATEPGRLGTGQRCTGRPENWASM